MKKKIIFVLVFYLIMAFSYKHNINILYPYYYIRDFLRIPVFALSNNKDLCLTSDFKNNLQLSFQNEVEELKSLLNIKTVLTEFDYVNATVIMRNPEYWFNTLTIDKGTNDGITKGMAVIDDGGLIGRISDVHPFTSTITLITSFDTLNKVSVMLDDIYGITDGYDEELHLLKVIVDTDQEIMPRTKVLTTGMGGIYPKGILIGEVVKSERKKDGVTKVIYVLLSGNIKGESYVSVLQRKNSSIN